MGKNIVGIQRNGENSAHSQKMLESRHPRSCFVCMRARMHPKSVRIIKLGRISLRGPPISYVSGSIVDFFDVAQRLRN